MPDLSRDIFILSRQILKRSRDFWELSVIKKEGVSSCILGTDYTDFTDIFIKNRVNPCNPYKKEVDAYFDTSTSLY